MCTERGSVSLREHSPPPLPRCCPRCLRGRRGGTLCEESCAAEHCPVQGRWPRPMLVSSSTFRWVPEKRGKEMQRHRSVDDNTHAEMCQMAYICLARMRA